MPRRRLPLALAAALAATAAFAAPAGAGSVVRAHVLDPQERPGDGGRDLQLVASSFDAATGTWTLSARFFDKPAAETSALLRATLTQRAADGTCVSGFPGVTLAAYTDPADRGGRAGVDGEPVDAVKALDGDGRGFTLTVTHPGLAGRAPCGVQDVSLSRNEPFDRTGDLAFPAAAGDAPPPPGPVADATPPSAVMTVLRAPRALRRGRVRVSVRGADEPVSARISLYGPGGLLARTTDRLTPGQELRPALSLGRSGRARLERTGRLAVRVVVRAEDAAGNALTLRRALTLRLRTRSS